MLFFRFAVLFAVVYPALAQKDLGRILPEDQPLHILAFGDFGSGNQNQIDTAHAMQRRNEQEPFQLGLTMGDNFYRCGVRSVDDPKWQSRWEDLYTPLGIRFFATLGNHDYGHPPIICPQHQASPQAEIERTGHSESWNLPARYYTYTAGPVRFVAIDTEGWTAEQLDWIRETLKRTVNEPGVTWRIVYGHHPIFTSGHHLNQRRIAVLRRDLLPVLQEGKVDLVISGHDHDMEHLVSGDMDFLIAGSGGADLRSPGARQPQSKFRLARLGFLDIHVDRQHLNAQYLGTDLKPLEKNPLSRAR